jgi:hypothetical protein
MEGPSATYFSLCRGIPTPSPLLADRGSEGLRVRSRDAAGGSNPRPDMGWPDLLVSDAMMMMAVNDTIGDKLVSPMNSPC